MPPEKSFKASSEQAVREMVPGLAWFDVADPMSPELDELGKRFGLHPLEIEDCRHRPQRAKVEDYPNHIFAVLKYLSGGGETTTFEDLDVFIGTDFLITVHPAECTALEKVGQRARQKGTKRLDEILYTITDHIVDEYLALLDRFSDEISRIEGEVLERPEPPVLAKILGLKRRLIEFRRTASGMREVVNGIMRREHGPVQDELDPYFRDVYDHLMRTVELAETQRDLLTGSLDVYLSAVANRTNEVVKVLTIYGTIALPLVIITSFFGMNLHLPWTNNPYGVWYASGLMLLSTAIVLIYFKRKRWY
jgi:magnesium transporter